MFRPDIFIILKRVIFDVYERPFSISENVIKIRYEALSNCLKLIILNYIILREGSPNKRKEKKCQYSL